MPAADMSDLFGTLFDDGPAVSTMEQDKSTDEEMADFLGDTPGVIEHPEPKSVPPGYLFFDLECVPDYGRESLFDLPPVPQPVVYAGENDGPAPSELIKETVDEVKAAIAKAQANGKKLPRVILDAAVSVEQKRPKPRKGVIELFSDMISAIDNESATIEAAKADRRKKMSVSPEMCRIVSLATARGSDPVEADCVDPTDKKWHMKEAELLKKFWGLAGQAKVIGGFNSNGYDLPVIFMRSMLLGVAPSRKIDLTPWKGETCDLMALRWPRGPAIGLKAWATMMGVPIEAGDVDGSMVEEMWRSGKLDKLKEYNRSDVSLVREIYRRGRGMWWV